MEKLPTETAKAFAAFKIYAEMGVDRSTHSVAKSLSKSWQLIRRWSATHGWVERAAAFDRELERIASEAEEQKLIGKAGLWAKRIQEHREESFELANKLIEKAEAMLKFPLADQTSKDGKTVVKPGRWTFADAARMLEVASRLKQLATGLPTDRLEHAGPDGQPLPGAATQVVFYVPSSDRDKAIDI